MGISLPRAGARTSRCYGESGELLDQYAVYAKNMPDGKLSAAGLHKPNDVGLFDFLGNSPHGRELGEARPATEPIKAQTVETPFEVVPPG